MKDTLVKIAFVVVPALLLLALVALLSGLVYLAYLFFSTPPTVQPPPAPEIQTYTITTHPTVEEQRLIDFIRRTTQDDAKTACSDIPTKWGKYTAIGYSHEFDYRQDPVQVTVYINPVVVVDDYFVNFDPDDKTTVFKNSKEITGAERGLAISKALQAVDGLYGLVAHYTVSITSDGYTTTNFTCQPQ